MVSIPQPEQQYTIHGGWVLTFLRVIDSYGCDADVLLAKAGLGDRASIKATDRIPFEISEPLWALAVEETGDPCIGLKTPNFFNTSTFHALGIALLSSNSLLEALSRLTRFGKVLGNAGDKSFTETSKHYCFQITVKRDSSGKPIPHYASIDGLLSVVVSLCRELYPKEFNPLRVELIRPEPSNSNDFEEFFKAPVSFSAEDNRIYFDKASIETHLNSGDKELALQVEQLLSKRLASYDRKDVINLVRDYMIALLPDGSPSESIVAEKLNITERTLQRKLREANCSFRELLNDTRKELACQHLLNPDIPINEIAFVLGYAEETNFARAFKRWTGLTPSEYRRENDPHTNKEQQLSSAL